MWNVKFYQFQAQNKLNIVKILSLEVSEPKLSCKFCAVVNWRPPEQTWKCERANFLCHQFALHFECKKFLLDTILHYILSLFLYLSTIITVRLRLIWRVPRTFKVVISDEICWSGCTLSKSRRCCMIESCFAVIYI